MVDRTFNNPTLNANLMWFTGGIGAVLVGWALVPRLTTMRATDFMILAGILLCHRLLRD